MAVDKALECFTHFYFLLFLYTHFGCAQSTLIVPSQPVIVPVGSDVTLPCQLDPFKNMKDQVVEWARHDLMPRYVHIRRDGLDLVMDQNSQFQGRTSLLDRGLQVGDMSLQLRRVRLSDGGTYRCYIPQMDTGADVRLYVVSVSPVSVALTRDHSGSPVLRCESKGWYPEPELDWLDSDGTVLTGEGTEVQRRPSEETFSVSSRLSVEQSHGNTLTCRVKQQETRQSREAQLTVKEEFLEACVSCSAAWTLFSLSLCLLLAAVGAMVVWRLKLYKTKAVDKGNAEAAKGEEMKNLLNTGRNEESYYNEDLEKVEDELEYVEDTINKLNKTRDFLLNLKEKRLCFLKDLEELIEQQKRRTLPMVYKDKRRQEKDQLIDKLEKQKKDFEEMLRNLDEQIKETDFMISKAFRRTGKLEGNVQHRTKNVQNQKKHQEAALTPTMQQVSVENETKTDNQDKTVQALDQKEEAQATEVQPSAPGTKNTSKDTDGKNESETNMINDELEERAQAMNENRSTEEMGNTNVRGVTSDEQNKGALTQQRAGAVSKIVEPVIGVKPQ